MNKLKDKIKKFPKSSGVYFFIDKNKTILYVGRATSLKNRVSQYFGKNIDERISEMVSLARDIKYIETENLLEAIILEAKNIKKCSQQILEKHNGQVPMNMDDLINLAGVGRKTANVVMGDILKKPEGIVVDTHVKRLSNRIGFVKNANPIIIERELMEIVEEKNWFRYPNLLINHGRARCMARKPDCINCEIKEYCNYGKKQNKK